MSKECSVENCSRLVFASGFCEMHYRRLLRHGDPLAGGTFVGEPHRYFIEAVLLFDGDECLIWPYAKGNRGHAQIWRGGRNQYVSRLVCEARYGPSPSPKHEAAHSCGKGHEGCVNPRHLRWATPKENCADRLAHGTLAKGERQGKSKLKQSDVHQIRAFKGQKSQREIAKQFNISQTNISAVQRGVIWSWLE